MERLKVFDQMELTNSDGTKTIANHDEIQSLRENYPMARATLEDNRRQGVRKVDYAIFGVAEPIEIPQSQYELLTHKQMGAYLRVCQVIAEQYPVNKSLRTYINKVLLRFEQDEARSLVEDYHISTIIGAQFASDVIFGQTADEEPAGYKTLEVNFGPVGGISEGARGQTFFPDTNFALSPEAIMIQVFHGTNEYYNRACNQLGIAPKPLSDRAVVYVENDGWYPGSVDMVKGLNALGMNIVIAPREALSYDLETNQLCLINEAERKVVDQLMLDFNLVNDVDRTNTPGDITRALQNNAVVGETSVFTQVVLGSKTTMALIDRMVRNQDSLLVRNLGIDKTDLEELKDMFANTYQWGKSFFDNLQVNGFKLREFFKQGNFIAKITSWGLYGGRGVYIFNPKDGKILQDFAKGLREITLENLVNYGRRAGNDHLRRYLLTVVGRVITEIGEKGQVITRYPELAELFDITGTKNENRLGHILDGLRGSETPTKLEKKLTTYFSLTDQDVQRYIQLHDTMHGGTFNSANDIENFLKELAYFIRVGMGDVKINPDIVADLQKRMLEKFATGMFLPIVLQEKVEPYLENSEKLKELRVSGTVGVSADNNLAAITAYRHGSANEPPKILYPVTIKGLKEPHHFVTDDPASQILEVEDEAPQTSTALDLSLLPNDRKFDLIVDPMCGLGRHARMLVDENRTRSVLGIDISLEVITNARGRNSRYENISFQTGDTREVFDQLKKSPDGVIIVGNSLMYLNPMEQEIILKKIYQTLVPGGILTLDMVDLQKYEQLLNNGGPIVLDMLRHNGQMYQRIGFRRLTLTPEFTDYFCIRDTLVYVKDQVETTHEDLSYYVPTVSKLEGLLKEIGFSNIASQSIVDDYYRRNAAMMWFRQLMKAEK